MNKLLTALFSGALLFSSSLVLAADSGIAVRDRSAQPNATQARPGDTQQEGAKVHPTTPQARSANENPRDPNAVYSAELKKCDSMRGSKKQQCIAAAKKKSGEM